jgi:hypothetical protein
VCSIFYPLYNIRSIYTVRWKFIKFILGRHTSDLVPEVHYLTTLSIWRSYSVSGRTINEYGADGGIRIVHGKPK